MTWTLHEGDCREVLAAMPVASVQCCVTSPPYWGLRKYAGVEPSVWGGNDAACRHEWGEESMMGRSGVHDGDKKRVAEPMPGASQGAFCRLCGAWRGCLGLEPTMDLFVAHLVEVFRAVRRVLRPDGVLLLNLGDTYNSIAGNYRGLKQGMKKEDAKITLGGGIRKIRKAHDYEARPNLVPGLKSKDLCMVPARVALALQADGWYLRSDIIWAKPNPMPESVTDRPTSAYEHIFLLTKSARYFWDADAVREGVAEVSLKRAEYGWNCDRPSTKNASMGGEGIHVEKMGTRFVNPAGRNLRNVWTIPTQAYPEAHFATFPEAIPERCVKAGTSERGCCPTCGRPHERVVEKGGGSTGQSWHDHGNDLGGGMSQPGKREAELNGGDYYRRTLGWRPACECTPAEPVPCTVCDPFCGSGTSLLVAARLGRHAIGIEASAEYAALARDRIGRGLSPATYCPETADEPMPLFEEASP